MNKTIASTLLSCAIAFAAVPAHAADKQSQTFITKAIQGNMTEIQMGEMAQSKGQSEAVKSFGETLVKDHTDAKEKATAAAQELDVTPPDAPSKKQKADLAKFEKMSGAKFDREFAMHMVADHKKDIADYTKESKMKSGDAAVTYASETLPTLKKHLDLAQSLNSGKAGR